MHKFFCCHTLGVLTAILTGVLFLTSGFLWAEPEIVLVRDARPEAQIVTGERPTRSVQFAAFEIQHVIELISGAALPIVEKKDSGKGIPIILGPGTNQFKGEAYSAVVQGDGIYLGGNDSPDYGRVDYKNYNTFPALQYNYHSTLYAAYDFLEIGCGVRFYDFGDDGITLKKRGTLSVKPFDCRVAPGMDAFRLISTYHHPMNRDTRLLQLRWRNNVIFGLVNHNTYSILFRHWGPAKGLEGNFIGKHPEYFAQGAPYAVNDYIKSLYINDLPTTTQVCTSQPAVVEYFAEEAYSVFQNRGLPGLRFSKLPRMEGMPWYYPIQEDDNPFWCRCLACEKSFPGVKPEDRYKYQHFDFVNRIATAARKLDPAINISTLAYSDCLGYPDPNILKMEPNVGVMMCLGIQAWMHPYVYKWQHDAFEKWVKNESKHRLLTVWTYMMCPESDAVSAYKYGNYFPVLYPWRSAGIYREFVQSGIRGTFLEVAPRQNMLEAYVVNRIAFDPKVDSDKMIDEYFDSYYGKAGKALNAFYREVENITWNPDNYPAELMKELFAAPTIRRSSVTSGLHSEKVNWALGTPERMGKLQKIVDEAQKCVPELSPVEQRRFEKFMFSVWNPALEGRRNFDRRLYLEKNPLPHLYASYAGSESSGVQWQNIPAVSEWWSLDGKELKAQSPTLQVASNDKHLHIRYQEKGGFAATNEKADIWRNGVEIFMGRNDSYPFVQLAFAPSGQYLLQLHTSREGVASATPLESKPLVDNRLSGNGWLFTVTLPLEALGFAPGECIRANFMRNRRIGDETSWAWSLVDRTNYIANLYRMGLLYLCPAVKAGELPVHGEFLIIINGLPYNWLRNFPKIQEPDRTPAVSAEPGKVTLNGLDDMVHLMNEVYPAHIGTVLLFEFTASGDGRGEVGAYVYAKNFRFSAGTLKAFDVDATAKKYLIEVPLNFNGSHCDINGLRPMIAVPKGSRVTYSNLKVILKTQEE